MEILIYANKVGRSPFIEWLDGLDDVERSLVKMRMDRLRVGNFGDIKPIKNGQGIWELRFYGGPGYRIYFGKKGACLVILLVGGDKGSQSRDIVKAKKFWREYQELL